MQSILNSCFDDTMGGVLGVAAKRKLDEVFMY
jgi:hypothetical protein